MDSVYRRAIAIRSKWSNFGHLDVSFFGGFITARIGIQKTVYYLKCIIFIYCGIRLVRV